MVFRGSWFFLGLASVAGAAASFSQASEGDLAAISSSLSSSSSSGDGHGTGGSCEETCSRHGSCDKKERCLCSVGYCGEHCQTSVKKGVANPHCSANPLGCVSVTSKEIKGSTCGDGACFSCVVANSCNFWSSVTAYCAGAEDTPGVELKGHVGPVESNDLLTEDPNAPRHGCFQPCKISDTQPWDGAGAGGSVRPADLAVLVLGTLLALGIGGSLCFVCFVLGSGRSNKWFGGGRRGGRGAGIDGEAEGGDEDREFENLVVDGDSDIDAELGQGAGASEPLSLAVAEGSINGPGATFSIDDDDDDDDDGEDASDAAIGDVGVVDNSDGGEDDGSDGKGDTGHGADPAGVEGAATDGDDMGVGTTDETAAAALDETDDLVVSETGAPPGNDSPMGDFGILSSSGTSGTFGAVTKPAAEDGDLINF